MRLGCLGVRHTNSNAILPLPHRRADLLACLDAMLIVVVANICSDGGGAAMADGLFDEIGGLSRGHFSI